MHPVDSPLAHHMHYQDMFLDYAGLDSVRPIEVVVLVKPFRSHLCAVGQAGAHLRVDILCSSYHALVPALDRGRRLP